MQGPAAAGQLVFLCGGDKELFDAASKDLDLMGKVSSISFHGAGREGGREGGKEGGHAGGSRENDR